MNHFLTTKLITLSTVGALSLFINSGINAEIYKWTDSKGVVHYSAQKPTQRKVKSKNIEDEIRSAAGKHSSSRKKVVKKTKPESTEKANAKLSGPNAELVSYCKKQRSNLDQLQKNFRNVWQGVDGKKTKLNQGQRKEKANYLQQTINENCAGVK